MSEAGERGSATVELAIIAPALLALIGLVIVAGRIQVAASAVEQAASAAARAASIARDARSAQAQASLAARGSLASQGIACEPATTSVDTGGFAVPVGQSAIVTARVGCRVALADLAVPGMPGSRTVAAEVTSPIDRFRARG